MLHIKRFSLRRYWHLIAAACIGAAVFLLIYGIEPLRVTGIGWTEIGYNGRDISQHQAGWMFYRNSPWSFPLCNALDLGYPKGTVISYTDSIPIVALFFKLISNFLPNNFQYFGLYTIFCFMMQGIFGAALLFHFTHDRLYSVLGSILFIISSAFLERSFRHTALSSYWLLLAALMLYLNENKDMTARFLLLWTVLLCFSLGIHPYLFGMVCGVFVFSGLHMILSGQKIRTILCSDLISSAVVLVFGFVLGLFGNEISPAEGFGRFSLNLNALFNPRSKYHSVWSSILVNRPVYDVQGDGIYYLGFGLLELMVVLFVLVLIKKPFSFKQILKRNSLLLILLGLYTLFAISNTVTFDDTVLLTVPLPEKLFQLASIFRASERFFLLPYYCLILAILTILYLCFREKRQYALFLCMIVIVIQTIDCMPGLKDFRLYFSERKNVHEYSKDWQDIAERYNTGLTFEQLTDRVLAIYLARKGFRTNMNISAKIQEVAYWNQTQEEREQLKAALEDGSLELDPRTIYIIPEIIRYQYWSFNSSEQLGEYLENVRAAYEGKAELRFLSMNLNDEVNSYWILCPNQVSE